MTLLAKNTAYLAHIIPRLEHSTDGLHTITLDVPAARKEDVMTLLEYVPVPVSSADSSEATTFQPPHPFLAVAEPDAADRLESFRTLSQAEKSGCDTRTEFVVCDGGRPRRSAQAEATLTLEERCLISLFTANATAMAAACPASSATVVDALIPLDKSTLVAVAAEDNNVKIICKEMNYFDKFLLPRGALRIDLQPGCEAHTRAGVFYAEDHPPETRVVQVDAIDWAAALHRALDDQDAFKGVTIPHLPEMRLNLSVVEDLIAAHKNASAAGYGIFTAAIAGVCVSVLALCLCGAGWLYFGCRCDPALFLGRSGYFAPSTGPEASSEADHELDSPPRRRLSADSDSDRGPRSPRLRHPPATQ
jgi:hypothetical protein